MIVKWVISIKDTKSVVPSIPHREEKAKVIFKYMNCLIPVTQRSQKLLLT